MLIFLILQILWPIGSPELQTCDQVFTADDTILASQTYETESGATGTAYVILRDVLSEDGGGYFTVIVSDDCEVLGENYAWFHYLSDGRPLTADVEYIQYEQIGGQEILHFSMVTSGGGRYTNRLIHKFYVIRDQNWMYLDTELDVCKFGTIELRAGDNPDSFYIYYEEDSVCDTVPDLEYGLIEVWPDKTSGGHVERGDLPFWYSNPRWVGYVYYLVPCLIITIPPLGVVLLFLFIRRKKLKAPPS